MLYEVITDVGGCTSQAGEGNQRAGRALANRCGPADGGGRQRVNGNGLRTGLRVRTTIVAFNRNQSIHIV